MAEEFVGAIVMEVDGQEIECKSFTAKGETGRTVVKTMNRKGRAAGTAEGIKTWSLDVEVPIPVNGELDWGAIKNAKITIYPVVDEGQRETYYDCSTVSYSAAYKAEGGEAVRSLNMVALDYRKE